MARIRTPRLRSNDPAWGKAAELWGASISYRNPRLHRITVIAESALSGTVHARTECGSYLVSTTLFAEPVDSIDECDTCLIGDDRIYAAYLYTTPDGQAIYNGFTEDLPTRIDAHRTGSAWWTPDLQLTYDTFATEDEARRAEIAATLRLRPLYNKRAGGGGGPKPTSADRALDVRCYLRPDVIAAAIGEKVGAPGDGLSDKECAAVLGISPTTYWRIRTDPDYPPRATTIAAALLRLGREFEELVEIRDLAPIAT